jgi:hypothetical protein
MFHLTSAVQTAHRKYARSTPWHRPGEATARAALLRLQDRQQIRAAVLALILTPGSHLEHQCWSEETAQVATALSLHRQTTQLSPMSRIPVLEALLKQVASEPAQSRSQFRLSARRIMCADGLVGPLDRLHWLLIRHLTYADDQPHTFTDIPSRLPHQEDVVKLDMHQKKAWSEWTAYLARMVPRPEAASSSIEAGVHAEGMAWYARVTARIWPQGDAPAFHAPDGDQLVNALFELQALPRSLRPLIASTWLDCLPTQPSGDPQLHPSAAEALRIACRLIEVPLPAALEAIFI